MTKNLNEMPPCRLDNSGNILLACDHSDGSACVCMQTIRQIAVANAERARQRYAYVARYGTLDGCSVV